MIPESQGELVVDTRTDLALGETSCLLTQDPEMSG